MANEAIHTNKRETGERKKVPMPFVFVYSSYLIPFYLPTGARSAARSTMAHQSNFSLVPEVFVLFSHCLRIKLIICAAWEARLKKYASSIVLILQHLNLIPYFFNLCVRQFGLFRQCEAGANVFGVGCVHAGEYAFFPDRSRWLCPRFYAGWCLRLLCSWRKNREWKGDCFAIIGEWA